MPLRIAIAAWNSGPLFDPAAGGVIGGLETSAWLLARALATWEGCRVTFVLRHTRSLPAAAEGVALAPVIEPLRNVRLAVSTAIQRQSAFPWFQVQSWPVGLVWQVPLLAVSRLRPGRIPPLARLQQHVRSVAPDIWLALGASQESAVVIETATASGISSIFWVRSNADLDARFFHEANYCNAYGVRAADARSVLQRASAIICQTAWQQQQVATLVGREARLIRNPVEAERWMGEGRDFAGRNHVLWIGRYDRWHKRPMLGLEVARRLPHIPFVFVINRGDANVERTVRRALPANVRLLDFVPRDRMPQAFAEARVLLFTGAGEHEGFPNLLLEAAAAGVPSVSLEEFDGFLERSGGNNAGGDVDRAARQIEQLWSDRAAWEQRARLGREYVLREHSIAQAVAGVERTIDELPAEPISS